MVFSNEIFYAGYYLCWNIPFCLFYFVNFCLYLKLSFYIAFPDCAVNPSFMPAWYDVELSYCVYALVQSCLRALGSWHDWQVTGLEFEDQRLNKLKYVD